MKFISSLRVSSQVFVLVHLLLVSVDLSLAEGSKIEANHGENVTLAFPMDKAEEADRLRIIFKEETTKDVFLIAQKCAPHEGCDNVDTPGVSLIFGKGLLSVIIQKVDISRSGLYKAEAFFGEKVFEVIATLAVNICGHVSGSKLEATEGHNVSITFQTGLERVDEVQIIFGQGERKRLLAKYCSPHTFPICDPIKTPHHLQVKGGKVCLFLVNVDISWSGLYTARVITDNHEFEVTNTLVVNPPVSSSPAPPHSSSPNSPRSTDLRWLVPVIVIPLVIVVLGVVCFWKLRMIPCFKREKESGSSSSVSVTRNGGGETAAALLTVT